MADSTGNLRDIDWPFHERLGFVPTGELDGREVVLSWT